MSDDNKTSHQFAGIDVLVIDDDAAVRDSLRVLLEANGLSVCVDEDIRTFAKFKMFPACVVLDLQLNNGCSFELMKSIESLDGPSKIVVITGSRAAHLHDRAYASGADLILEKPFLPSMLVEFVRSTLAQS